MKNHNKILEAVNRGIKLALDDYKEEIQLDYKGKCLFNRYLGCTTRSAYN